MAIDNRFTRIAVFVDEAVGTPGQIVFEGIVWEGWQRANPHTHITQTVKTLCYIVRDNRDESWR